MAYVRAKKSKKNRKMNSTKQASKAKKRRKVNLSGFARPILEKTWDKKRTVRENFHALGLAANPNDAVAPIRVKKPRMKALYIDPLYQDAMQEEEETVTVVEPVQAEPRMPTQTVKELERLAIGGEKLERHVAPGEVEFITFMMKKYGTDYKAMSRDKRNIWQHTPKQIKRKVEAFLRSKQCRQAVELCRETVSAHTSMEA